MPPAAAGLEAAGYSAWKAACLARRGVADAEEAAAFLAPSTEQLSPPDALPGIAPAADRLAAAAEAGDKVAIVGDYDVDGVSATALLTAVLRACGARVEPILPHRMKEGYGFQTVHVEQAREAGCSLVLTADCGSSSYEAAAAALDAGLGLIVTDHHLSSRPLPPAAIEINPRRRSGGAATEDLAAAGIALKLALAVAERCGRPVSVEALLRVACLGTVADMVPLRGENRVIAALGLAALPDTPSRGLRALMSRARVGSPVSAADIGFRIGPRLNAAGRMGGAQAALELLLTRDASRAAELADLLEERNRRRREAQREVEEEAAERFADLAELPPILVGWSDGWHRGVVGIAAGRLARQFHRPTVLLSVEGDTASGSGRSVPGIHLFDFLEPWRDRLLRFGGHAQAVGLTAGSEQLEQLRDDWHEAAAAWPAELLRPTREYEFELPAAGGLTPALLAELRRLGPFGVGNPEPVVRSGPLRLCAPPREFGRGHLSLEAVDPQGGELSLLGWSWAERAEPFREPFEVLGVPIRDRYRNRPALRITDVRPLERTHA